MKVNAMLELDKQCVWVFDEMSSKTGLTYNAQTDSIEGFENLGSVGTTKYVANYALAFMVCGLALQLMPCTICVDCVNWCLPWMWYMYITN